GLELDAEGKRARILQNLEKILAHENLAAAQSQDENAGVGHLLEQVLDFDSGHLPVVVVIKVAVNALLVAAVGQIKLHTEGNAQPQRPVAYLLHYRAHRCCGSCTSGVLAIGCSEIGCSEIRRMPCLAKSSASASASRSASSGFTSNSEQMRRSTISSRGVAPSAACQRMVAVGFNVNSVE